MRPLYECVKEDKSEADKMSEDEAIQQLQYLKNRKIGCGDWLINCKDRQAIETLLDLYNKEKEKNNFLKQRNEAISNNMLELASDSIRKDKIREFIAKCREINMDVFTFEIADDLEKLLND